MAIDWPIVIKYAERLLWLSRDLSYKAPEIQIGRAHNQEAEAIIRELAQTLPKEPATPIPMRLPCPRCGELHVDVEFKDKVHHTHACQHCGEVWRPAVVATVGVQFLPGFKDAAPPPAAPGSSFKRVDWNRQIPTHVPVLDPDFKRKTLGQTVPHCTCAAEYREDAKIIHEEDCEFWCWKQNQEKAGPP